MTYYLAIDIGASSGRHILAHSENGKLEFEEIYRFENDIKRENGSIIWDISALWTEVLNGLKKCRELGKIPKTVGIDTWGVDYVLLDRDMREILPVIAYRDERTKDVQASPDFPVSFEELYSKCGIQYEAFNTVYQLWCDKKSGKLANAEHFLMIPDYLAYKLTGILSNEYTNASTGSLVNAKTLDWDDDILSKLGIDKKIFSPISLPSSELGGFSDEVKEALGFDSTVVLVPTHDTASAVSACPLDDASAFISSGTWSLFGTENSYPVLSDAARLGGLSNEGGADGKFCFLKNIMGMWLFRNVRSCADNKYSYDEMMDMARKSTFCEKIDPNAPEFVAPENMLEAIRTSLKKPELPFGDVVKCIYISLASAYADTIAEMERASGKVLDKIIIVGGGSKQTYLNELTKEYTGKRVFIGLDEGTACGNVISQLMWDKNISLSDARDIIRNSFDIREV